jgi:hypothetical protein
MSDNIVPLNTPKQASEDRVKRTLAAIDRMGPELQGLALFGKCKDGTFVTMTANVMDLETLGYSQAQISALSTKMGYYLDTHADDIDI